MPAQTTLSKLVYPDGLHFGVSTDDGSSYDDVGVMTGDVAFTFNGNVLQTFTSNAGQSAKSWRDMTVTVAPAELVSFDSEIMEDVMGGIFTRTAVAGAEVAGDTQVIPIGYTYDKAYELDGQQSDGAIPTAISVGQETVAGNETYTTALVLNTDYWIKRNTQGIWCIILTDTATVDNTLASQVTYTYTPATGAYLKAGTTSKTLTDFWVRFRHYTDLDAGTYDFEIILYKVLADPGSLVITKRGAQATDLDSWTVGLTAEVDTTRTDDDQLVAMFLTD